MAVVVVVLQTIKTIWFVFFCRDLAHMVFLLLCSFQSRAPLVDNTNSIAIHFINYNIYEFVFILIVIIIIVTILARTDRRKKIQLNLFRTTEDD